MPFGFLLPRSVALTVSVVVAVVTWHHQQVRRLPGFSLKQLVGQGKVEHHALFVLKPACFGSHHGSAVHEIIM